MRPTEKEYARYYQPYIDAVNGDDLIKELQNSGKELVKFYQELPEDKWNYSYDVDKWTPLDILLHLIDSERIFCYRALRFSRGDTTNLSGFDHNQYVINAEATNRSFDSLIKEFKSVRSGSVSLFQNMTETDIAKVGMANNNLTSCRALGFVIVGHTNHHVNVIRDRYL